MLEELRKWIRAVPFQPFQIELSSGRVLKVPDPDHILVTSGGMVGVEDDAGVAGRSGRTAHYQHSL
jgi:hypothetical protein